MKEFEELIKRLIIEGADPNALMDEFEQAVLATELWCLWGDMRWRQNFVCSKCGSSFGGVCHDPGTSGDLLSNDPGYHHHQVGVKMIPFQEWKQDK